MKTAMAVLLTSAAFMLPAARAEEGHKDGTLSKGEIKAQQQFKMLDFNHDGKLSRSEVALIPKLAAAFDETDTNKDGYVTYEEVRAFAVKYRAEREKAKAAEAAHQAQAANATVPEHDKAPASNSEAAGAQ